MKAPMRHFVVPAVCLTAALVAMFAVLGMSGVSAAPSVGTATAKTTSSAPGFTQTDTVSRTKVGGDGTVSTVASNNVTLNVSQTTDLQGRQEIQVSWSGAHPTGGVVAQENSDDAQYEEYPFVLLECRGVDSSGVSAADQLSPQTCWTAEWDERYQESQSENYPPYQLDQYASTPGAPIVGQPSPVPSGCSGQAPVQYWVPWVGADGTVYDGGVQGCAGTPPESTSTGGTGLAVPSNETFGVTGPDGTGSADFDVFTSAENGTLGCSQTVACSLVAVPIMGISCDGALFGTSPTQAELSELAACEATGTYAPGVGAATSQVYNGADLAVTGSLWWSPSNWRNRISVPLTFAPPANACSLVTSNNSVSIYGSELMIQAAGQWAPSFCANQSNNFSLVDVDTGEPEARTLVASGSAEAAFTSYAQTGGYGEPVVNAPVAVTGFAVSFAIDGADGQPITTLKLTPLLLAKLLTESYPEITSDQGGDPALAANPLNITDDPDFISLNPDVPQGIANSAAASELISLSSDSDVIEALTTYINDDPTARAWLNGTSSGEPSVCDSSGVYQAGATDACPAMVVNPAYKGIQLPIDQWPLLSTYELPADDITQNLCLQASPEPWASLVAAPLANLEDISEAMQFDEANSTITCSPNAPGEVNSMVSDDPYEAPGYRFMLGITPLADNQRDFVQAAELQTTAGTFVAPSNASMEAATDLLKPDATTGTWPIPYSDFETTAGASAYPGTMVVYAAIPTTGLPAADAVDYASFLNFAATTGQTVGNGVGQLPAGYLPLTAADGLGALANYTAAAAVDVAAQNGQVPPVTGASSSGGTTPTTTTSTATTQSPTETGGSSYEPGSYGTEPFSESSAAASPTVSPTATSAHHIASKPTSSVIQLNRTLGIALFTGGLFILLILGPALLAGISVLTTFIAGRRRGKW